MNGTPLYAVRVKIGRTLVPGKIGRGWDKPNITLLGKEVGIGYDYEILVSTNNMEWIEAQNGHVPSSAVPSGIEDDGSFYYLARAELKTKEGVLGNFGIGKKVKSFQPGKLLKSEQGARIPFAGKEHIIPKYEVLCFTKK